LMAALLASGDTPKSLYSFAMRAVPPPAMGSVDEYGCFQRIVPGVCLCIRDAALSSCSAQGSETASKVSVA
jgi:hypothetical protein